MSETNNTGSSMDLIFSNFDNLELFFTSLNLNKYLSFVLPIICDFSAEMSSIENLDITELLNLDFNCDISEISNISIDTLLINLDFISDLTAVETIIPEELIKANIDFTINNTSIVIPRKLYETEELTLGDLDNMTLEELYYKEVIS